MVQDNKEFDKLVKDLLYDAEEEVPAGIMDDVFSRLDNSNKKSVKLPPWLGWSLSGVAIAAAVALFVVLRPGDISGGVEVRQDLTAESAESSGDSESSVSSELSEAQGNMLAYVDDSQSQEAEIRNESDGKRSGESVAELTGAEADTDGLDSENDSGNLSEETSSDTISESSESAETVGTDIVEESVKAASEEDAVSAPSVDNEVRTASVDKEDSSADNDTFVERDPFAELDEEDTKKSGPNVSLLLGGDISTNNEAKGLSGFGGFRIPSLDAKDVTYVEQVGKSSSYSIPLTFGLGAKVNFTKRWAVGAGVNWTMLRRTFNGRYVKVENGVSKSSDTEVQHTLQYVGIPVNAFYNIIQSPRIKFYTYAGGTVEKGISNVYRVQDIKNVPRVKNNVKGVQLSAGAGLGVEFIVVDWLGVYINPGVRYYFDCDQPVNIRTQQPFMMDFEIGLRVEI